MARSGGDSIQGGDIASQLRDAAVIATVAAVLSYTAIFLLRGGLEGTFLQYAGMLALALLPVWLSTWAVGAFGTSDLNRGLSVLVSVSGGVAFPLLGFVAGPFAVLIAAGLLLFCFAVCVIRLRVSSGKLAGLVALALVSAGLIVMLGGAIRLFMPEALTLGIAPSDAYWHTAIMQMIARHLTPSIGGDGLVYQHYHYFFHILVAGTASITGADVPLVYGLWSALALKIQLVWCMVCAGCLLFRAEGGHAAAWRFTYAWVAAILAYGFETESYVLGVLLFTAWLPLMVFILRAGDATDRKSLLSIALLCFGVFFIALGKASVGYFGAIALFLLLWNYRAKPAAAALIAVTLAGLALFAELVLIPKELVMTDSGLPILVNSYLMYFSRGVGLHYFLPAFLALVYLVRPHVETSRSPGGGFSLRIAGAPGQDMAHALPSWIARGRGIARPLRYFARADVNAQLVFLMWLGLLFVLFTMPIGDNIWDFSAVLLSISLLLLPMALGETVNLAITDRLVKWALAFALTAFVFQAALVFVFNPAQSLIGAVTELYRSLSGGAKIGESVGARRGIRQSLSTTGKPFSDLQAKIDLFPIAKFERDIARQAKAADGHLAVNIAPEADEVWRFFLHDSPVKWCMFPHLLVPATTGILEIRSVPPARIQQECSPEGLVWYGFGKYQDQHRTANFTPAALCALARPLQVRKVYRLVSYSDLSKNSVISCTD
jgi:hypothetical protein